MIKVAVIGAGILGEVHAQAVSEGVHEELVAVCDLNPVRAETIAKQYQIHAYTDYHEMLKQKEIDAVIVATPDFAHAEPVIACLQSEKHVLMEKPLATTLPDAKRIREEKNKHPGLCCMVNYTNRWSPPFAKAKEMIQSGKMGAPVMMSTKLNDTLWVSTEMMSWASKTSCMSFLGSHDVDLFLWMFECGISEVYATGVKKVLISRGIDSYDAIQASVKFENGCIGTVENSWIVPNTYPITADGKKQIYLERGFINMDTGVDQIIAYDEVQGSIPTFNVLYTENGKVAGAFKLAHDHFIDCILEQREPEPNVESAYRVAEIIEAMHRSIKSGKPVTLPLS